MDRFIAALPAEPDGDLMLCGADGIAYQRDMSKLVPYDAEYFNRCAAYEDQDIARKINEGRIAIVAKWFGAIPAVCDVGIGSGEFIKKRTNTFGHDVNPVAIEWLKRNDLWAHDLGAFGAHTFWDVIEHVPVPEDYFRHVHLHGFLFTSLPIFGDLQAIRASKHYRPGEHLYYWTEQGFVAWMLQHGFRLIERQGFEIEAGRESIQSFAFKRHRWPSSS